MKQISVVGELQTGIPPIGQIVLRNIEDKWEPSACVMILWGEEEGVVCWLTARKLEKYSASKYNQWREVTYKDTL